MSPFYYGVLVGALLLHSIIQILVNAKLQGRIQGIAGILQKVKKRSTD